MRKAKTSRQNPIRVTVPFQNAVSRALQAPSISDADLRGWVERRRKKRKPSELAAGARVSAPSVKTPVP